jgi:hypothetical protein
VSGTAARCPAPAVDHHNRWTRAGPLLDVGVERQLPGVGNISLDAGNDVVAVGIADVERGTWLRGGCTRTYRECEEKRNERKRQPAGAPAVSEGVYGCRTASANAVSTSFVVKLQWP